MMFSKYQRPTVLWALFVLVMCSIKIGDNITNEPLFFPGFDKLVHTGFFFLLVILWCNGIIRQQKDRLISYKTAAMVTFITILFGGLIELLQLTIFTWRSGEWGDFASDGIGACMAAFSIVIIERALRHEKN